MNSLTISHWQFLKSWYFVCFISLFNNLFITFKWITHDRSIWILLSWNQPMFLHILKSLSNVTIITTISIRIIMCTINQLLLWQFNRNIILKFIHILNSSSNRKWITWSTLKLIYSVQKIWSFINKLIKVCLIINNWT